MKTAAADAVFHLARQVCYVRYHWPAVAPRFFAQQSASRRPPTEGPEPAGRADHSAKAHFWTFGPFGPPWPQKTFGNADRDGRPIGDRVTDGRPTARPTDPGRPVGGRVRADREFLGQANPDLGAQQTQVPDRAEPVALRHFSQEQTPRSWSRCLRPLSLSVLSDAAVGDSKLSVRREYGRSQLC